MPTIGSQVLVRILPRTRYDFGNLREVVIQIPVAQHIDVLGFEHATLQVRVYRGTLPAKSSLRVHLADDGFSADDSTAVFLQTMSAQDKEIGTLHLGERTVFPFYQSVSTAIPGVLGRLMAVVISFAGGPEGGPSVELSMDLVLSGGSVGAKIHQPSTYLGYAHEPIEPVEPFERLTPVPSDQGGTREERLATVLSTAIREALGRGDVNVATRGGGYPRFGNVNVGIDATGQRPDVAEGKLATVLSTAVREALLRGDLNVETPDGGYARFGNVNVGLEGAVQDPDIGEERLATILSGAVREALRRGDLDVATPDGGYARFGNVNVGMGRNEQQADVQQRPPGAEPKR